MAIAVADHGSSVSFFIGTFDAGTGPGLHLHPYDETFDLSAGQITVVPANTPHRFVSGEGFRVISIAPSDHMV